MSTNQPNGGLRGLSSNLVAIGVIGALALMIVPVPAALLDLLLVASLGLSVVMLLQAIYTRNVLQFSSFPSLLLIATLYRLSLNISSTRLILSQGDAGSVIRTFGDFAVAGELAVGVVIFLILIIVNFMVITKGANRVGEVAARFRLDMLPGKQLAIDGMLSKDMITEEDAMQRRLLLERETDYYSAMEGASKFVRGDAIAGLIITLINIGVGLMVGVFRDGMPLGEALNTYTTLTIGDGLVSQIPALLISTAAGFVVTTPNEDRHLGWSSIGQLTQSKESLWVAGFALLGFTLIPGFPKIPFIGLSALLFYLGSQAPGVDDVASPLDMPESTKAAKEAAAGGAARGPKPENEVASFLTKALEMHVGFSLVSLIDKGDGEEGLAKTLKSMRKAVSVEFGAPIPICALSDNLELGPSQYSIRIRGSEVARGKVFPKALLAIDEGGADPELPFIEEVVEAANGLPARWIGEDQRMKAEMAGYTVVTPREAVATHFYHVLRRHVAKLISQQEVQALVDAVAESHPSLILGIIPEKLSLGKLSSVVRQLLEEGIPVGDMVTIIEALISKLEASVSRTDALVEGVRMALQDRIAAMHMDGDNTMRCIAIDIELEHAILGAFNGGDTQTKRASTEVIMQAIRDLEKLSLRFVHDGRYVPLVVTTAGLRPLIRQFTKNTLPYLPVLAVQELPSTLHLREVARWGVPGEGPSAP